MVDENQMAQLVPPAAPQELRKPEPKKIVFDTYEATIEEMDTHMRDLWEFRFSLNKPISFTAGQYVSVFLPGMKPAPFSIASSPAEHGTLSLGVEIVGKTTTAMSQLKPGDKVTLKGPFGNFVMGSEKNVCFLAGGVGITPFMSMLRSIRDLKEDRQAILFYSCKEKRQFLWLEELERMAALPNVKIVLTCTREAPEAWTHETGRINPEMIRKYIPDYRDYVFYCCGPPALINAMRDMVIGMGVPEANFKREAWHSG